MTRKDKTRTRKRCSGPVLTDICTTHDGASEFQVPDQKFPYKLTGAILKKVSFFFLSSVEALRSRSSVDERRTRVNGPSDLREIRAMPSSPRSLVAARFLFRTCTRSQCILVRTFGIGQERRSCLLSSPGCQVEDGRRKTRQTLLVSKCPAKCQPPETTW